MGDMRLVPPDESWMFAPVTGSAVDASFEKDWLTDGASDTPVQASVINLTITPAAMLPVDVVAVINHNIAQGTTITLGGSLTGVIPTDDWKRDGLPRNWYKRYDTPINVTTATLFVSGAGKAVIGECYGGLSHTLSGFLQDRTRDPGLPFEWEGEGAQRPPYDSGVSKPRRLSGQIALSDDELEDLEDWDLSTRRGTRPILLIPDDDENDAWLVTMKFSSTHGEGFNKVSMEFLEIPRNTWDT